MKARGACQQHSISIIPAQMFGVALWSTSTGWNVAQALWFFKLYSSCEMWIKWTWELFNTNFSYRFFFFSFNALIPWALCAMHPWPLLQEREASETSKLNINRNGHNACLWCSSQANKLCWKVAVFSFGITILEKSHVWEPTQVILHLCCILHDWFWLFFLRYYYPHFHALYSVPKPSHVTMLVLFSPRHLITFLYLCMIILKVATSAKRITGTYRLLICCLKNWTSHI